MSKLKEIGWFSKSLKWLRFSSLIVKSWNLLNVYQFPIHSRRTVNRQYLMKLNEIEHSQHLNIIKHSIPIRQCGLVLCKIAMLLIFISVNIELEKCRYTWCQVSSISAKAAVSYRAKCGASLYCDSLGWRCTYLYVLKAFRWMDKME